MLCPPEAERTTGVVKNVMATEQESTHHPPKRRNVGKKNNPRKKNEREKDGAKCRGESRRLRLVMGVQVGKFNVDDFVRVQMTAPRSSQEGDKEGVKLSVKM